MEINRTSRIGSINPYRQHQESQHAASAGKKGRSKDQVEISSEAKDLLKTFKNHEAGTPREKIELLQEAVESGAYQVDARLLAEKLYPFLK